jgi:exodeoxyribonuclease V alpha subunit
MRPVFEGEETFDSQIQLNHDLIILDEGSMLDSELAGVFFSGIKSGAKVIVLGDPNQLPSVGCGNVLADIIKSGKVPVTRLTSIYRQDGTSPIIINANKIKDEDTNIQFEPGFEYLPAVNEDQAVQLAINEFLKVLPIVGQENVALLTPYRFKTKTGCNNLNRILEPIINPEKHKLYRTENYSFKKGDVIIRTQNDNRQHICNGTIGVIADINSSGFMVDFGDGRNIFYAFPEFKNFDLAYANTIHKSQGSEYSTVILLIMPEHVAMLSNSVLYTGVTRAKQRVIIIGNEKVFKDAILKKTDIKRTTLLTQEIINVFNKNRL